MKKKIMVALCVILSLIMFAGCSSKPAPQPTGAAEPAAEKEWKFERKIEMVCPFGPGSGTDTTLRAFLPMMEKELGVSIVINNVEGASGVKGAEYLAKQPADGYTFGMFTPSHVISAVNGTSNFDILNDTIPVVRLVQDANIVLAGKKVPYNNLKELVEYAKANPGKAKIGLMSIAGIDAVSVKQLFDAADIDVPLVPYSSGAEVNAAVIGGHCDMVLTSPFDANAYLESGDMKAIVILSEKRASTLPDVECTGELGYNAYIGPWRGIVAMKGTPEGAIKAFEAAAVKVCASKEWDDWKNSVSLNDREGFANREQFTKIWLEYYETMKKLLK
ncbi:Bug family tripartite tricarboxylate transporter substrate binding protein [Lutispora sp.]|uniref:Bug family tripartite tricarboxylate transporter substrate binding protein n=1 Tax=Lutispora sp. TaxID=2828727 RepID=UPI002B209F0B|nr:tripartite tricarboxylate transporter substrate binding protein [Lutispora sp.]MEA4960748.1 tripartite tricarboxylate transporter substrate binding protein [Lutispora sp.]